MKSFTELEMTVNELKAKAKKANARAWVIGVGAVIFCGLCIIGIYRIGKERGELATKYIQQKAAFQVKHNQDKTYRVDMQQRYGSVQNALALAENKLKGIKPKSVVKTEFIVRVDTLVVPYTNLGQPINFDDIDTAHAERMQDACIPVGTQFSYSDSLKYIAGTIGAENILIDSLGLTQSSITVTIGEKKRGLFKKREPIVQVDFSHPNIKPVSADNVQVVDNRKTPILLSRVAFFLYGLAAGLAIP